MLESMFARSNFLYIGRKNLSEVLPPIVDKGIDCIEFHAMGNNTDEISKNGNTSTTTLKVF